jgi:hypothetical protein
MKKAKINASFRLSEKTIKDIDTLSARHQVSKADVISVLVHAAANGGLNDIDDIDKLFDIVRLG